MFYLLPPQYPSAAPPLTSVCDVVSTGRDQASVSRFEHRGPKRQTTILFLRPARVESGEQMFCVLPVLECCGETFVQRDCYVANRKSVIACPTRKA